MELFCMFRISGHSFHSWNSSRKYGAIICFDVNKVQYHKITRKKPAKDCFAEIPAFGKVFESDYHMLCWELNGQWITDISKLIEWICIFKWDQVCLFECIKVHCSSLQLPWQNPNSTFDTKPAKMKERERMKYR